MDAPRLLLICILSLLFHFTLSSTVIVDGVTDWKHPTAYIGDSIIFKLKNEYKLYIFQNKEAFKICNFARATLLSKPNSTSFIWHSSRLGYFYFSFNNGSTKPCQDGKKLAIKVLSSSKYSAASPKISQSAPPAYQWPFRPRESSAPTPSQIEFVAAAPTYGPRRGGGLPFINSNPVVVPFPTGEVDSATIGPKPTSGGQMVVGFLAAKMALCFVTFVLLLLH